MLSPLNQANTGKNKTTKICSLALESLYLLGIHENERVAKEMDWYWVWGVLFPLSQPQRMERMTQTLLCVSLNWDLTPGWHI